MNSIQKIANYIEGYLPNERIVVVIDGIDTSGKTSFAKNIKALIKTRHVVCVSIDHFHNEKSIRMRQGEYSPNGYYHDSFNYEKVLNDVLIPFRKGESIVTQAFDHRSNKKIEGTVSLMDNTVLLFDGVFMQREVIRVHTDLSIYLDISFEEALNRAVRRDLKYFTSKAVLISRYQRRYLPGQSIYLREEDPKSLADFVIDNNNYHQPKIVKEPLR
jgi:uridine kinase